MIYDEGFNFLPFGKGKRACPGADLAVKLVALSLGTLIQYFDSMKDLEEDRKTHV